MSEKSNIETKCIEVHIAVAMPNVKFRYFKEKAKDLSRK